MIEEAVNSNLLHADENYLTKVAVRLIFVKLGFSNSGKLNKFTFFYYFSAFIVSVLFASMRYSTISRPIVFIIYLHLIGLVFMYQIVYFRKNPESLTGYIRETLLSKILPLVLSIVILDWLFQHTTPRGFRGLQIENSDEAEYVKMMLNGIFSTDTIPYKFRWLTPLLTGSFNILPVKDLSAFTVLNFASLIMTSIVLIRILQELKINKLLSLLVPFFLFNAYLGRYAARNHYLTDPATYMFFSIYLWCLIDTKRYVHLSWLLVLGTLNSEKCVFWLPIILIALIKKYSFKKGMLKSLVILGPAVVVFFSTRLFLGKGLLFNIKPVMLLTSNIHLLISLPFSYIYFPFSFLTIFFVMGFNQLPVILKISSLVLLPIYFQIYIANDIDRMIAYTFIIYIPASLYYVQKLFEEVPYDLGVVMTIPFLLVAYFKHRYTLPLCLLILLTGTEFIPYLLKSDGWRSYRLQNSLKMLVNTTLKRSDR